MRTLQMDYMCWTHATHISTVDCDRTQEKISWTRRSVFIRLAFSYLMRRFSIYLTIFLHVLLPFR